MDLREFRDSIRYPTPWSYKVIGRDREQLIAAIAAVLEDHEHSIRDSKVSSRGAYLSLEVSLVVVSEEMRLGLFHAFWRQAAVLRVL